MEVRKAAQHYLNDLSDAGFSLMGFYQQGSSIFGLADEFSDTDFIAVWKVDYPAADIRRQKAEHLGFETHDFRDVPQVQKGLDAFVHKGQVINIAHIKAIDFFNFYQDLHHLNDYYEEMFMRLEGFKKGLIVFDPEKKLEKYRNEIVVTPETAGQFKEYIKDELEHDLKMLTITAERKGIVYFLKYFIDVINNLRIIEALQNSEFPGSLKWFESISEKSKLLPVLGNIQSKIDKVRLTSEILQIAYTFGFKPSKKIKA